MQLDPPIAANEPGEAGPAPSSETLADAPTATARTKKRAAKPSHGSKRSKKRKKRPAHRPTIRNKTIQKRLLDAMKVGCTREQAADAAGIAKRTLYRWLEEGEAAPEKSELYKFWRAVEMVRNGHFRRRHLTNIDRIAYNRRKPNWQASAWLLERNFPEDYSLTQRLKLDAKVNIDLAEVEALRRRMDDNATTADPAGDPDDGDDGTGVPVSP